MVTYDMMSNFSLDHPLAGPCHDVVLILDATSRHDICSGTTEGDNL